MTQNIFTIPRARQTGAWFWLEVGCPSLRRARSRGRTLLRILPSCSFRRLCIILFAGIVVTSASRMTSSAGTSAIIADLPITADPNEVEPDWSQQYAWLSAEQRRAYRPLVARIEAPVGFRRAAVVPGGFADWLRHLPAAPVHTPVETAGGRIVLGADHPNLACAIRLQPNRPKLLRAANMMIRLRAEYIWATGGLDRLGFHFTSGQRAGWSAWAAGARSIRDGGRIRFADAGLVDSSRDSFCAYLETIFHHASATSLLDDTRPVPDQSVEAGDILLRPGRKGHAMMVLDIATDGRGQVRLLLGQGGTPAQTFHVLRSDGGSPWFPIAQSQTIGLGQRGEFETTHLRRWQIRAATVRE